MFVQDINIPFILYSTWPCSILFLSFHSVLIFFIFFFFLSVMMFPKYLYKKWNIEQTINNVKVTAVVPLPPIGLFCGYLVKLKAQLWRKLQTTFCWLVRVGCDQLVWSLRSCVVWHKWMDGWHRLNLRFLFITITKQNLGAIWTDILSYYRGKT